MLRGGQVGRGKRRELAGTTFVPAHRSSKRAAQLQYGLAYNYAEQTVGGTQVTGEEAVGRVVSVEREESGGAGGREGGVCNLMGVAQRHRDTET